MRKKILISGLIVILMFVVFSAKKIAAQENRKFTLTAEKLQAETTVDLSKIPWKYHSGDEAVWSSPEFDDTKWETVEETIFNLQTPLDGWEGRAWFRLKFDLGENLVGKNLALIPTQTGASEVYMDGMRLVSFGEINEMGEKEYNPNHLPVIFHIDRAGEHTLAVRYSSSVSADPTRGIGHWLAASSFRPGFTLAVRDAADLKATVEKYANDTSMRPGFFLAGFLFALAILHFLLYIFYRAERGNLFYSIFAAAFAINLIIGNLRTFGHSGTIPAIILSLVSLTLLGIIFTMLTAFLLVAFKRPLTKIFWALTFGWIICLTLYFIFLSQYKVFQIMPYLMIGLSFAYCSTLLVKSLREKRPGAWILLGGVLGLQLGMVFILLAQFNILSLPGDFYFITELAIILGVPLAVSIFLARNFANTNRELKAQLIEVENLSQQKIEQERQAAELRAENERRARELEEARELQISMLPKSLPELPNLAIAAYMKPATEVGGDYYDFHVGKDGTLTVAVGDATGHGLKAGTVVTATKGLFNNLAGAPNIPNTFRQISRSLKLMNLRGLFMAMAMLKIKDGAMTLCVAGMPSVLIYRAASKKVQEISVRALPLGSISTFEYQQREISLSAGDCVVLMSDGFPEMFNPENEILGFDKASDILPRIAMNSAQEIINELVKVGEKWANGRPQDDDVTFVVLKIS